MAQMYKFVLYDNNENQIGHIKDVISAKHVSEVNGEDYLEIETLQENIHRNYRIVLINRYYRTTHEFIVKEIEQYKQNGKVITRLTAENSIVELMGFVMPEQVLMGKTFIQLANSFLSETRWTLFTLPDDEKPTHRRTVKLGAMTVRAALNVISEQYDLEMETVIEWDEERQKVKRWLRYSPLRGAWRAQRFSYTKNTTEIVRTVQSTEIVTALRAVGKEMTDKDGNTYRVVLDENFDKAYVANEEARKIYGILGDDGVKRHHFGFIEYNDVETVDELKRRAKRDLATMSKPSISYEMKVKDFYNILESGNNYIELGDTVRVIDRDFVPHIDMDTRIIRMEIDLVDYENTVLVVNDRPFTLNDRLAPGLDYEGYEDNSQSNVDDLLDLFPGLRRGLLMWVDAEDTTTVVHGSDSRIKEVYNSTPLFNDIGEHNPPGYRSMALVASDTFNMKSSPTYSYQYNKRAFKFEPEDVTFNSWKISQQRPDVPIQKGQYLLPTNTLNNVRTAYIVMVDRTRDYTAENSFNPITSYMAGFSTPFYPGWKNLLHDGYIPGNKGVDTIFDNGPGNGISRWTVRRQRGEIKAYKLRFDGNKSIKHFGMSKESEEDYAVSLKDRVNYEQNAFFRGDIFEIILFNRSLSGLEQEALDNYFKAKYSVSDVGGK